MNISALYIHRDAADSPLADTFRDRLGLPARVVDDPGELFRRVSSAEDPVLEGKKILFLTRNKGAFVRDCPGTRSYTCCGYKILHIGAFCVMDCSYCILQAYFHPPVLQFFVNWRDLEKELDDLFSRPGVARVGTGEFTDSMIWEPWTNLSALLTPRFAGQSRAVLEYKTKTTAIQGLKDLRHNRKTIVSWSMNTERVIREQERGTASLSARLRAAAQCEKWGYPLAFHFDPMVIYEGCEADYRRVVDRLFSHVSPDNIVWISLGALRFMPPLKSIIRQRFPGSKIVYGEFIAGLDGKMRYFKPMRIELYQGIVDRIRAVAPNVMVYFCMEDEEVWEKTLGFSPEERGGLAAMLDESAARCCGLEAETINH
ncbi:MAG: DNA photolyase [Desulfobacterales bacterium]|nr:DNA photolyase [Desulfobacterales bacterium]